MINKSYVRKSRYNGQDERPVEKVVILYKEPKVIRLHVFKAATPHQSATRYEIFVYPTLDDTLITIHDVVINSVDSQAIKAVLND